MKKTKYRSIRYTPRNPHKFSKKIVVFCIGFIVVYTVAQTYLSYVLGVELSPTLTTSVYAFFGTELAASAIIKILDKEYKKSDKDKPVG